MLALTVVGAWHLATASGNPVDALTGSPHQSWSDAFGSGLFIIMWNYCGWDSVSNIAGEMAHPRRDLPKALAAAIALIMVGYLLPSLAALSVGAGGSAGWRNWDDGSFSDVAEVLAGPWLQTAVTLGGMFASVAMFSALLASNSRLPYVLSRDGYLPRALTRESRRFRMPVASIVGSAVIYALFCLSSFGNLVIFDVFLTNIGILLEVAALIVLRIREPELERPYRVPGGWTSIALITLSLLGVCAWAAWQQYVESGTQAVTYCLVVVGGSVLLYVPLELRRRTRARRDPASDLGARSAHYQDWLAEAIAANRPGAVTPPEQDGTAQPGTVAGPARGQ
jgi:amino acid transporter